MSFLNDREERRCLISCEVVVASKLYGVEVEVEQDFVQMVILRVHDSKDAAQLPATSASHHIHIIHNVMQLSIVTFC